MTLGSTVKEKSTFQEYLHSNAVGIKFNLDIKSQGQPRIII